MHYWFETNKIKNGDEYVTLNYDFNVDWGDGSKLERYSFTGDSTKGIRPTSQCKHLYDESGVYRVTIYGNCDALRGHNGNTYEGNKRSQSLIKCLKGVVIPKNFISPLKYAPGTFFGCEKLEYLGKGVFDNLTNCKSVSHLFDGCKITQLPNGILDNCTKLEDASFIFESCNITYIPDKLFHKCPNLKTVECAFHRSEKLRAVPSDLFENNLELSNAKKCFQTCPSLISISPSIFDKCKKLENVSMCFAAETGVWGYPRYQAINEIPELWNPNRNMEEDASPKHVPSTYSKYAYGCDNAINFDDVPDDWR